MAPRKGFDPAAARDADVVLLDWSQSEGSVDKASSPFGKLEGYLHSELPADLAIAPGGRDAAYWDYRPEAGENYRDVEGRILAFGHTLKGAAVIVSHGGIARTLRVLVEAAPVSEAINWVPPQDAVLRFRAGEMTILRAR